MNIRLNGEPTDFNGDAMSVRDMLAAKNWSFPLIVVRVNGVLAARGDWDRVLVRDGDDVDALHLVSGG
jgi:sulfur carrier protein